MPEATTNPKGIGEFKMNELNLFNSTVAEVKLSYSHRIPAKNRVKITCSKDIYNMLVSRWENIDYIENFYAILMNRGNQVLGLHHISQGGISGTVIDVRLILQGAILAVSSSIILAHNHPSGTMEFSDADMKITRKIKNACQLLDISVLDHIVISSNSYLSMADEGML